MKMIITIGNNNIIPQIINGLSANTLFYLMVYDNSVPENSFKRNTCGFNLPMDIDDFGRCYIFYKAFKINELHIQLGIGKAKKLKLPKEYIVFIENFINLCCIYEKDEDKFKEEIKKVFENTGFKGFWW